MIHPPQSPLWAFRNDLLRKTIAWCTERSSFYRTRLGHVAAQFQGAADLDRLPILQRSEIIANLPELVCERTMAPAHLQYTTGTTGEFLPLMRSAAESRFVSEFFSRRSAATLAANPGPRPLWLALTSTYHGSPTPIPGNSYVLSAGVYDGTQAAQAHQLLSRTWSFPGVEPRVSTIVGGDILLKALTAYLLSRDVDPSSLGVRRLVITGGYMTAQRKQLLCKLWGATLQDRYSMSELFGGASEIGLGGPWAFDTEIIPEVVHPGTHESIDEGVGVLVLTGLYPFMQMMPLVRYYTGDLVQIVRAPGLESEQLLVRFVGRERRAVLETVGEITPLILPGPLHELVEGFPDIGASGRFADIPAGKLLELAGKLHYGLAHTKGDDGRVRSIELTLGLRYPPQLFPRRTAELVTTIRERLYEQSPALRERVADGSIDFSVQTRTFDQVPAFNSK